VILMGPTGTPTHIEADETVLLAGGGLGTRCFFQSGRRSGPAARAFLLFRRLQEGGRPLQIDEIEAAADVVVWCCDEARALRRARPADRAFVGNIVQAIAGVRHRRLASFVRTTGSRPHHRDRLRSHDGRCRQAGTLLKHHLKPLTRDRSINSPSSA